MSVDQPFHGERFMRLFVEHERDLLRYVLAVVPSLPDARDIVQETAVALWRKMADYGPARPFLPWACRFASKRAKWTSKDAVFGFPRQASRWWTWARSSA